MMSTIPSNKGPGIDLVSDIVAAWPETAYPGDEMFGDCWCEECADAVNRLRGKSWMEIGPEDAFCDGGSLSGDSFAYYLPGLMIQALIHGEDCVYHGPIYMNFVVWENSPARDIARVRDSVAAYTPAQRDALMRFIDVAGLSEFSEPTSIDAARKTVATGEPVRVDHDVWLAWYLRKEKEIRAARERRDP